MYKFSGFTQMANNALNAAVETAENLGHTYIGSEHLLVGLLHADGSVAATALSSKNVNADDVENILKQSVGIGTPTMLSPNDFTPRSKRILESSVAVARAMGHNYVGTEHILIAIAKDSSCFAMNILASLGVSANDIINETTKNLSSSSGEGHGTSASSGKKSNTPTVEQFGKDLTELARQGKIDPVIGRQTEINRVIQILSRRTKNNPCLIGEPGVGKTAIAEGLALKIAEGEAVSNPSFYTEKMGEYILKAI